MKIRNGFVSNSSSSSFIISNATIEEVKEEMKRIEIMADISSDSYTVETSEDSWIGASYGIKEGRIIVEENDDNAWSYDNREVLHDYLSNRFGFINVYEQYLG